MAEPDLTPRRWQTISRILDLVLDAPESERQEILQRECADDAELRADVTRLLEPSASEFLDGSAPALAADLVDASLENGTKRWAGKRIGAYVVREVLGAGGMGVVYLAERADEQFQQRVALKLIRTHAADPVLLQRFLMERQILADLDHPNIARLLDGGVTDDDSPYIVMEYSMSLLAWISSGMSAAPSTRPTAI